MSLLLKIAERALNRPLLVHPDKLPIVLGILEGRIPLGDISALRQAAEEHIDAMPADAQQVMRGPAPNASRFVGSAIDEDPQTGARRMLPYSRTAEGVAIVTVTGSLINRGAWIGSYSGETSYEGFKHQLAAAVADPRVRSVLLDIESPGGEAVGALEAAEAVRNARAVKPVVAVVNGMAASAAYAIASGASRIVTTPSGVSGSIGVVLLHADYSRFLDKSGVTPTLIFAGAHKVDGNPFEPLPDGVREDLKREVDQFYDLFVATVSAGRKGMSPAAIRGTEARTFVGADAVAQGIADSVGTFEDVLAELSRGPQSRSPSTTAKGSQMDMMTSAPAAETAGIPKAEHDAAVAKAREDGKIEGAATERDRLNAIDGMTPPGMESLRDEMKADGGVTADMAARRFLEADKAARNAKLQGLKDGDKLASVAAAPLSTATAGTEAQPVLTG
jgi:signal peptide peptidase SppA